MKKSTTWLAPSKYVFYQFNTHVDMGYIYINKEQSAGLVYVPDSCNTLVPLPLPG